MKITIKMQFLLKIILVQYVGVDLLLLIGDGAVG